METPANEDHGRFARNYITAAIAVVMLFIGLFDRYLGLIAIPVVTWFLLRWLWKSCEPSKETSGRFNRSLFATTAGALLALAIHECHAKTHHGNTAVIQTRDEIIEYGDDVLLRGPDKRQIAMTLLFAGIAFWFSVAPDGRLDEDLEKVSSLVIDVNRPFGEKYSVHMSNGRIYPIKLEEFESLKKQHLDIDEW